MIFRTLLLAILLPAAFSLSAQQSDFVHIDVHDYTLVDSFPAFTKEVPLGTLQADDYKVELLYPEYIPLTREERKWAQRLEAVGVGCDDFRMEQWRTTNRKEHFLTVRFSPIVKRGRRWMRLASCKIHLTPSVTTVTRQTRTTSLRVAAPEERWTNSSVLSSGKWVKIRVAREGIYELTPELLRSMGFEAPERVKVYGYGGLLQDEGFDFAIPNPATLNSSTPDDLVEMPTLRRSSGILFWAEGTLRWNYNESTRRWVHTNNHYSTHSYYFLTEGDAALTVETLPELAPVESKVDRIPFAVTLDDDRVGWYAGGRRMFDGYNFADGNARSYRLSLPDADLTDGQIEVSTEIAFSASSTQTATMVQVALNGGGIAGRTTIGTYNTLTESARASNMSFTSRVTAPDLSYDFTTTVGNPARLDYIRVNYPRRLTVAATPYSFTLPSTSVLTTFSLNGGNDRTVVWRIGQRGSQTAKVPTTLTAEGCVEFTTDTPMRRFVAFDAAASYPTPEVVGEVANQNLHADRDVDYVIIIPTSGKLLEQAERLAEIHRKRSGMSVKVVRAGQLYNEFSSGTPDANAYRRYLKMLYDRATTTEQAPRYLLFLGRSPWDGRLITDHWRGKSPDDYLLAYEVDASQQSIGTVNSYVTDDFFALLDDNEGVTIRREKMDLAVGRMVCTTAEEAQRLVDNVERYLSNQEAGTWKNEIVMLGDDGDANEHMHDADIVAGEIDAAGRNCFTLQKIYWDRYNRQSGATGYTYPAVSEQLKRLMNDGALMFNYSGHGAPYQISHEKSLVLEDFRKVRTATLPLWVLASCEIFPLDAEDENIAETSLFQSQGGSIAFMCATRAVYASQNNAINKLFSKYVLSRDVQGKRIPMGEALRLAKVELISTAIDLTINKQKYVLFGDPALPLAFPTGDVVLERINDQPITADTNLQLPAGSVARFTGYVTQSGSTAVAEDFSGQLTAEVFDRPETIKCKNNDGSASEPFIFTEQVRSIFRGTTEVRNGRFDISAVIPRDISYSNTAARIRFYALSDDRQQEANGQNAQFYLNGTSPDLVSDTTPPAVLAYLNTVETPNMAIVNATPTFIAQISDDSGISVSGTSMGHDLELVLDGQTADPINLNSYFTYEVGSYQKGQVVYPLSGLSSGLHRLDFRAWDINNNSTLTTLRFFVRDDTATGTALVCTPNPTSTTTTFICRFTPDITAESTIAFEVFDSQGHEVWRKTHILPAGIGSAMQEWDLRFADGRPAPSGIYLCRVVVSNSANRQEIAAQKLIVVRP